MAYCTPLISVHTFLSYAFRPFFLFNALFSVVAMALWAFVLQGNGPDFLPANSLYWHAHEMVVGFGMATVAGFVLTAVATWTGRPAVQGYSLGLLVLCWLAGRVAMALGGILPPAFVFAADMLFPTLLVVLLAREVFGADNQRNKPIVFVIGFLALLNVLYHLGALGVVPMFIDAERIAIYLLVHMLLLLITVIGGRIIPNFTANWLKARGIEQLPGSSAGIEKFTILLTVFTGLFAAIAPLSFLTGCLALAAAVAHAVRLSRWCGLKAVSEPLLFILHVAYAWLPIGYLLTGLAALGLWVPSTAALHALTVGAIGTMIMGVTTRVSLAHTGRKLHASRLTVACYFAVLAAAVLRLAGPFGSAYLTWINAAIIAWVIAFTGFALIYLPVLTAPRVDE